ncbi:MAG: 4-Cys prefix domain-containing protein, partial [Cyanobacteria bacterium J06560_2]
MSFAVSNKTAASSHCFNQDCQHPQNEKDAMTCASCESPLLLKGRYRALKLIGQGGFGRTFQGRDEETGGLCAIKQFWVGPNSWLTEGGR